MKKVMLIPFAAIMCGMMLSFQGWGTADPPLETGKASAGDPGYTYKVTVDKIQFHWKVAGASLHIRLRAKTAGWVGVGFNPSKAMKDANFILGYVKDGIVSVTNHHGISSTLHRKNTDAGGDEHVTNPSGKEKNNETEISFTIPLSTGAALDRPISVNGDTVVLLAYGKADQFAQQHSFRAKLNINLASGKYSVMLKGER